MSTLTSLSASLLLKMGLPSTDGMLTQTAITELLNEAIQQISSNHSWPWLYTEDSFVTVAGTAVYTMPTSAIMLKWLGYKDDALEMVQRQDLVRVSQIQGRPTIYAEHGSDIILGPVPDGAYTIDRGYYQRETPLAAGSDTPLLPTEYSDYAVTVAAKMAAIRLGDTSRFQMLTQEEEMWSKRIAGEERTSMQTLHVKTRSDWWMGS